MEQLIRKSWEIYREGGLRKFYQKSKRYLYWKIDSFILFSPRIPPINFDIGRKSIRLGYRDTYWMAPVKPVEKDTLVEVGAYEGEDAAMFAKMAEKVIAFEPSPRNFKTARENLKNFSNVKVYQKGLWNEKDRLKIKYGEELHDDSFLAPDNGQKGLSKDSIPVNTLKHFIEELEIEKVNFIKIEAEGAEPEIVEGIRGLDIDKVVVNVDKERDGKSPKKDIIRTLQEEGYSLLGVKKGCMLCFMLDPPKDFPCVLEW